MNSFADTLIELLFLKHGAVGDLIALLPIVAIPALGYCGMLFTFAHQRADFVELYNIEKIRLLPAYKVYADQLGDERPKRDAGFKSIVFLDGAAGAIIRSQIARHTPAEYLVALAAMSVAYGAVGLFVTLPIEKSVLEMSAYAFSPFPKVGVAVNRVPDDVYAASMTALYWAFAGAVVYAFGALAYRVNSRDATPGQFYTLTFRLLLASAVALVLHHLKLDSHFPGTATFLPALYFFCGVFPQRIFDWLWKLVADRFKIDKADSKEPSLREISGIGETHAERLGEIGIDTVQALALADPIRAFVRLPYRLSQVLDWIAQAMQLWAFGGDGVTKLRALGLGNILETGRFARVDGYAAIADALGSETEPFKAKWAEIESGQP